MGTSEQPSAELRNFNEWLRSLLPLPNLRMVLKDDEEPTTGWLVESDLQWVHGGSPTLRAVPGLNHLGSGRSFVRIHVRVTDRNRVRPVTRYSHAVHHSPPAPGGIQVA